LIDSKHNCGKRLIKELLRSLFKFSDFEGLVALPHEINQAIPIGRETVQEVQANLGF
jgi:hypothetical protein